MKKLDFYKFQGTGNDFILIDNRNLEFDSLNANLVARLCDRRFGIGADGLMLLQNAKSNDFLMRYYNSDGKEASMCGNGGRCIAAFAKKLGVISNQTIFMAVDGEHEAEVLDIEDQNWLVRLRMKDVVVSNQHEAYFILDTGSPHYVEFVDDVDLIDIEKRGREIRYNKNYGDNGVNVNFVHLNRNKSLQVRTYERGVEAETFSCGTGVTASVIAAKLKGFISESEVVVHTKGGLLKVEVDMDKNKATKVWLSGPAQFVFKGEIII